MENVLFLQSELADPYSFYARMLERQPLFHDAERQLWAVYSWHACRAVLDCSEAFIPPLQARDVLAGPAATLSAGLVRLANPPAHAALRQAAMRLFAGLRPPRIAALLQPLLEGASCELDWIEAVCKKLPALALMDGLGLPGPDIDYLSARLDRLAQIMSPNKTTSQLDDIHAATAEAWPLLETHAARLGGGGPEYTSNLAGLLIQSYDAGRGLLGNALLQALRRDIQPGTPDGWKGLLVETLRYDPPIQNTRRLLTRDLQIGATKLESGCTVLVVLAAANRDPAVFARPGEFDTGRPNNSLHLTFGSGMHACVAREFSVTLAVHALSALAPRKPRLLQQDIAYAPLVNARLLRALRIRLE